MRANRGVPPVVVTVTASLNSTVTAISSPAMKTPFAPCGSPGWIVTPVTVGATPSAAPPATTRSPSVMAWSPRPSAAVWVAWFPASSRMVPPFRAISVTLIPFESESAETTG